MSTNRELIFLSVCLALAALPARGSEPEGRPAPALPNSAPEARDSSPRDVELLPAQVPTPSSPPRPKMPSAPAPRPGATTPPPPRRPRVEAVPVPTTPIPKPLTVPKPAQPPVREIPRVPGPIEPGGLTPVGPRGPVPEAPSTPQAFEPVVAPPLASSPRALDPEGMDAFGRPLNDLPGMIGDQAPATVLHTFATPLNPLPPRPNPLQPTVPSSTASGGRSAAVFPWGRGFKISDNQSPAPQDRVFYTFNYFNNLNGAINQQIGSPITNLQGYRSLFGAEKTLLDGYASVGLRLPIDTLSARSVTPGLGGSSTSVGNLTVYSKLLLLLNQDTGSLLSGGLALTLPTGPSSFAGSKGVAGLRDAQVQPFLGTIWRHGDWFVQGFSAIDVPTSARDVVMWYNDVGVGYYVWRDNAPGAFLSAVVPTFEVHFNDPLNHRGATRSGDPFGTADVVDLTFGLNLLLRERSLLTIGFVEPVTGPRPFNLEVSVLFNHYFGWTRVAPVPPFPPPL